LCDILYFARKVIRGKIKTANPALGLVEERDPDRVFTDSCPCVTASAVHQQGIEFMLASGLRVPSGWAINLVELGKTKNGKRHEHKI
jgi:hypothetical protein